MTKPHLREVAIKELEHLIINGFNSAGFSITEEIRVGTVPESAEYNALTFSLNEKRVAYRKGKVTPDRPGAFLSVWQRPEITGDSNNKPIPLNANDLDYLFVKVDDYCISESAEETSNNPIEGMFIFPVSLLIQKGVVSSPAKKGKTGFRVFPPWSNDRGISGTKVFSDSGKKTQRWQLPYFLSINENGSINILDLQKILNGPE
jgi:hypothetical protein